MSENVDYTKFKLPPALVSRADLARLIREVEAVDADLESQKVKSHDHESQGKLPAISRGLQEFLELNKLDLTNNHVRVSAKEELVKLKDKAPAIHMTFAVPADTEVLQQLVSWTRANAHPQSLLSIGIQPSLIGGAYIRTPNHVHDFSMRSMLENKRDIMLKVLETQQS